MGSFPSRERGLTFIGFLLVIGLIGFFALLILKIGPIYLDHYKVISSLESLKKDPDILSRTREEILSTLDKRWDINMVQHATSKHVAITKHPNYVKVQVAYDVTQPILANIDVLVRFDDAIEVGSN